MPRSDATRGIGHTTHCQQCAENSTESANNYAVFHRLMSFVVFLIDALMAATIAGLTTALLDGTGIQIASAAAVTFTTVLGMAMTAYQFVKRPASAPSAHTPAHPAHDDIRRRPRRARQQKQPSRETGHSS
ncbi:hypothetical protein Areg01_22770 [Actinoplanes regularis]|nr:hypothetical protein Areg01_22770 [Actinoplanes regularis]